MAETATNTPKASQPFSRKRNNSHLTPEQREGAKQRKIDFFKEHGASIFVYVFKTDLTLIKPDEIAFLQKEMMKQELDGRLDINTTRNSLELNKSA